jgi:hypothetical protein
MDAHAAAKILTEHNRWRRRQAPFSDHSQAPYPAKTIGEAIDTAVGFIHQRESATGKKARSSALRGKSCGKS